MSQVFFDEFELPKPNFYLGVGSGTHARPDCQDHVRFRRRLSAGKARLGGGRGRCQLHPASYRIVYIAPGERAGLRNRARGKPTSQSAPWRAEEIGRMVTGAITGCYFVTTAISSSRNCCGQAGVEQIRWMKKLNKCEAVILDDLVMCSKLARRWKCCSPCG